MAELTAASPQASGVWLASQQLRAIAWLRWRVLANSFRRKGGAGELIGRILLLPLFAGLALLPTALAGSLAWYFTRNHQLDHLAWILWGAFALTQLLNINLGQPGTTFDPTELIRFPMPVRRFVLIRLLFGLLSPANVIVSLISLAVLAGVSAARPHLFFAAALTMLVFAATNVLFTRMIFAWIDRWLSTRRARELFTAFIFIGSIGMQYLNVRYNPGFQRDHHRRAPAQNLDVMRTRMHRIHPYVAWLPPELTAAAIASAGHGEAVAWIADTAACSCFAALFLGIYGLRMRTEFRGENLSDAANATGPPPSPAAATQATHTAAAAIPMPASRVSPRGWLPPTLPPLLSKELLTMRRNVGLFYGIVAPAVMVFLFAGRFSMRGNTSHWVLLGAVAYALLGIAPLSYNTFGLEGTGAQFYFFAPVPLRDVFFAKNVFGLLLAFAEVVVILAITTYVAGRPRLVDCLFALLWALGTLLLNTTVGNLRSISAPKKIKPGRSMNKAQSAVSGYMAIGILLGCAAFGYGSELLALYLHRAALGIVLMAAFAGAAALVYSRGLNGIEAYALERRDTLFEELGKKV